VLILVRHAQSEANARGEISGDLEVSLTEVGRQQAADLGPSLVGTRRVLTSPSSRARETAHLAVPSLPADVDAAFREQSYGRHEGVRIDQIDAAEWAAARADHDRGLGGGESPAAVDLRVHERLSHLLVSDAALVSSEREHLLVVSHVAPIKSAVAWALGVPGSVHWHLRLNNATLTIIGVRDGQPYLWRYNERPRGADSHA
jgi:probable phosphoglycerate mutase